MTNRILKKINGGNKKQTLIIAYACEPNRTSEPGVGWCFSQEISKSFNTLVLTRENNKSIIDKEEPNKVKFIYYDLPNILKKLKKRLPLGTQLYYIFWQWGAYLFLRKFIANSNEQIDIVHHLNFGISWLAPPAYLLKKPLIWGPIGGGDFISFSFLKKMSYNSILQESIYYSINQLGKISPFSFLTRKSLSAVTFRTETAKNFYKLKKDEISSVISETASSDESIKTKKLHSNYTYAICVGRMTYWKGFVLAVKGFHMYLKSGGRGKLELFGNGPELKQIENYIKNNKLEKNIILRGFVKNDIIKEKMKVATTLLHPSFRDGGSWAIMEAMSYGLPVICLNTSGPRDMVSKKCGILIDLTSYDQVVEDIKEGLHKLRDDKNLYVDLSVNAQTRIKTEYNWSKRGSQMEIIYNKVLKNELI